MTTFVARYHGKHTGGNMVPSSFLQVDISEDQTTLLNPTLQDNQMATIPDQCSGKMAVKKIAKRCICYITNNVNSYAQILDGPKQLE
jgi:hypothetical protein